MLARRHKRCGGATQLPPLRAVSLIMRLAACLLAAVMIALAGAAPAGAAWSRQRVAANALDYARTTMAANDRGDAALVYDAGAPGLYVSVARPGSAFGRPRLVPNSKFGGFERIAVDEHGNVLVGWTYNDGSQPPRPFARDEGCCRRIRLALLRHGSTRFSVSGTIGPPGVDSFLEALAIINGRVGVAWGANGEAGARFSRRGLR